MANLALTAVKKTGIKLIDDQHLVLLNLIRDFDDAINGKKEKITLEKIFEELINYIDYHFKAEENLLIESGYPDFDEHKKKHDQLISQALNFQEKHKKGIPNLEAEIMIFLTEWIVSHINKSDMAYVSHVTGNKDNNSGLLAGEQALDKSKKSNKKTVTDKIFLSIDCSSGIEEIDSQHQQIMALINSLNTAISKKDSANSKVVLQNLIDNVKAHFSTEEKLLESSQNIDTHKNSNKKFIKKINMFQRMCNDGVGCSETEIILFLKDWFLSHIKKNCA